MIDLDLNFFLFLDNLGKDWLVCDWMACWFFRYLTHWYLHLWSQFLHFSACFCFLFHWRDWYFSSFFVMFLNCFQSCREEWKWYMMLTVGITTGYHRLWSHRSYDAHPIVRAILLIMGKLLPFNIILLDFVFVSYFLTCACQFQMFVFIQQHLHLRVLVFNGAEIIVLIIDILTRKSTISFSFSLFEWMFYCCLKEFPSHLWFRFNSFFSTL
jgi:hypothetical protein